MIEAVIWDFGGVFTTSPFEAFARYERERGLGLSTTPSWATSMLIACFTSDDVKERPRAFAEKRGHV